MKYYIDPTNHPYFRNLAPVIQHAHPELKAEISTDYSKPGTWILNYLSFRNGVTVNGPYIALQTEQMDQKGTKEYRAWLKGADQVWDWSENYLFGYSPVYRLHMEEAKDIDVLFYGEINERRQSVLDKLKSREIVQGAFGSDVMRYVMRSKIILSTHYYARPDNDMPRIAPLLSNHAFVICEKTADPKFNALSDHLVIVEKEAIPEAVEYYLARPFERFDWADKGFDWIRNHPHGAPGL